MTRAELAETLDTTVSVVQSWKYLKEKWEKKGVKLFLKGRGEKAQYGILWPGENKVQWEFGRKYYR